MKKQLFPLLSILLLLLGWETTARLYGQPELVPTLPRLFHAFIGLWLEKSFYSSVSMTICRGMAGMAFSLLMAFPIAWLMARKAWVMEMMKPWLAVMRSVPVISFLLLALIFLETDLVPYLIAFLTMFPLLVENLAKGFQERNPEIEEMADCFRISRLNRLTQILYPQLKPFLFAGLASASGFGWRAIIMGEVLAQCRLGIGGAMKRAQNFIDVPSLLAWTCVAILISLLFDRLFRRLSTGTFGIKYQHVCKQKPAHLPTPTRAFAIEASHLSFRYAIHDFSYKFLRGKSYGITAPSGTGKTTLLRLLAGNLKPSGGDLLLDRSWGISLVPQNATLLPQLTAKENITLPLARLFSREEADKIACKYLNLMELESFSDRLPQTLSYGQQQRVALARALAYPSPILLMDEPFKGLDAELTRRIIDKIQQEKEEGRTLIFTTHHSEELSGVDERIDLPNILCTFVH